jgi:protoporphyrinogen oxidase
VSVDAQAKVVRFDDGDEVPYDVLLSAVPLNQLVGMIPCAPDGLRTAAQDLSWNSGLFVGIGVAREQTDDKCWVYFPEENCPFYRLTYLSRYSPFMAPPGHMCLVTETSHSQHKYVDRERIVDDTIDGLIATRVLDECDRARIVDRTLIEVPQAYPVPTLRRDAALAAIQPWLMERSIYSRGRFGAWLYEIGNMDHSVMQGVEFVDHVLSAAPETVWFAPASERQAAVVS